MKTRTTCTRGSGPHAYLQNNTPFEVPSGPGKPLGIPIGLGMSGDALRLPFEVVPMSMLAHGQVTRLSADPQLARIQNILRERVIPKLAEAVGLLGPVGADENYQFIVSPLMKGDSEEPESEIDQTDVLALRAAASLLTAASRIAVAYDVNVAAYDSTGLHQAFQPGSGWMALAEGGATHMRTARTDMLSAIDDVDAALAALLAETDDQDDDVIKRGPDDVSEDDILRLRDEDLPDVRRGLEEGVVLEEDWDNDPFTPVEPLTINVGNLFTAPVTDWKALLPPYTVRVGRAPRGWNYRHGFGTANAQVTAPAPGSYSAYYEAYFDADSVYMTWTSGPEFLTDVLVQVLEAEIAAASTGCGGPSGSGSASFSGDIEMSGVQTIPVNWWLEYSTAEDCVYIPIIVWDADTFEEWVWPDPTFGGLLPEIGSMNEFYAIFGIDSSDFSKEWELDWSDANLPKASGF
jgi:hypothetical protein